MSTSMHDQVRIDRQRAADIQRMMSEPGGRKAVEQRYGKDVASSPEYKLAERRRAAVAREEKARRQQAAEASRASRAEQREADTRSQARAGSQCAVPEQGQAKAAQQQDKAKGVSNRERSLRAREQEKERGREGASR